MALKSVWIKIKRANGMCIRKVQVLNIFQFLPLIYITYEKNFYFCSNFKQGFDMKSLNLPD